MADTTPAPTEQPLVYFDRSRWERDCGCRRERYWNYEYRGASEDGAAGIVSGDSWELGFGSATHTGLQVLHTTDNITGAVDAAIETIQPYLGLVGDNPAPYLWVLEGLLRGWDRSSAKNRIMQTYDVVDIERELLYTGESGIKFACKPDLMLRHRTTGRLAYAEFKTTKSIRPEWFRQWKRAPQLLSATLAVRETYGEDLDHVLIQPLYKGYVYKGEVASVFAHAWRNLTVQPTQWASTRPTAWKGWEKVQAGEVGYPAWLGCIGQEAIDGAIPVTHPIYINPRMVTTWWTQATIREREVAEASRALAPLDLGLTLRDLTVEERQHLQHQRQALLDRHFPQNFKLCETTWRVCPYVNACWIDYIGDNPLEYGFARRTPHHDAEPVTED